MGFGRSVSMTNTVASVYDAVTTGLTAGINAYTGLAVAVIGTLAALALASKFLPKKKKIV